jgi:hypothetical protein
MGSRVKANGAAYMGIGNRRFRRRLPQGQKFHMVRQLCRFRHLRQKLEIIDTLSDRDAKLMGKDDSGKPSASPLSQMSFAKEVLVLTEEYASQLTRPIEKLIVWQVL